MYLDSSRRRNLTDVNLDDAHHAATTTTVATTTTTTPDSHNNKQRSTRSNRTINVIIWTFFVMAIYQMNGTFQLLKQKQLQKDQPFSMSHLHQLEASFNSKVTDMKVPIKTVPNTASPPTPLLLPPAAAVVTPTAVKPPTVPSHDKLITAFDDLGVNKEQNGSIVIKGDDDSSSAMTTKLSNDLEICFSPLINNDAVKIEEWWKRPPRPHPHPHHNFICQLDGIGSFQIIECNRLHHFCFIESRDEEDYGTPYFMKLGPVPKVLLDEMEIILYLSTINKGSVNNLTPKPHPRYPYIEWKRTITTTTTTNTTHDKKNKNEINEEFNKVAVIFEERLNFTRHEKFINKFHTIDEIMSSSNQKQIVQCWKDVLTVTEALWDYQGGHYIHDDIHKDQILMVPITKGGDNNNNDANNDVDDTHGIQYRCHVIDFGMVRSLDEVKEDNRELGNNWKNPFWYTQLSNKSKIADYISEYGIEEYYKRGWEFSVTQWIQPLFLKRLLKIMFGDKLNLGFNYGENFNINTITNNSKKYDRYDMIVAGWCQASKIIKKVVQKLEEYQKQRPDIDDALFRLVVEQSTIIDSGVSILNCTNYKAVLA